MIQCTIIIPTYNRPKFLNRILDYYQTSKERFQILITDSSSNENKKINRQIIALFTSLAITYRDHYSSKLNPHRKFAETIQEVETPYCVFCPDDDFIIPSGIQAAANFLHNNPDFIAAHGAYVGFDVQSNHTTTPQFHPSRKIYTHESLDADHPKERLFIHLSKYKTPTLYAVHISAILKMAYKEFITYTINPYAFGELFPSMLTVIYGKVGYLPILYGARGATSYGGNWKTIPYFIREGTYEKEYLQFKKCLVKHLVQKTALSKENSEKCIDEAMKRYLRQYFSSSLTLYHLLNRLKIPNPLQGDITIFFKKIHQKLKNITFPLRTFNKNQEAALKLWIKEHPESKCELDKIRLCVTDSKYNKKSYE